MKIKKQKGYAAILMISLPVLFLLAGCDYFTGPAGMDGGNVPGGLLTIDFSYVPMTADSQIRIVFDSDESVLSGNETTVAIPVGSYADLVNSMLSVTLTWSAPEIVPGSYYIYYWLDANGDGNLDSGTDQNSMQIFNFVDSVNYASDIYLIDPYQTMAISTNGTYLAPYYTVQQDFAPTVNILFSYSEG